MGETQIHICVKSMSRISRYLKPLVDGGVLCGHGVDAETETCAVLDDLVV